MAAAARPRYLILIDARPGGPLRCVWTHAHDAGHALRRATLWVEHYAGSFHGWRGRLTMTTAERWRDPPPGPSGPDPN